MSGRWPGAAAYRTGARLRDKVFTALVGRSFAALGAHSVVQPPVRLVGEGGISIGAGVFVGANSWLQVLPGGDGPATLEIGDGTSMAGHCVLSAAHRVVLGRSVLLARNVYIADHAHAFDDPTLPVLAQGLAQVGAVVIGDGAWLGQNVVVTPGVRIGRGAVVGANAVVTTDVPDRTLAVGVPARIVRALP